MSAFWGTSFHTDPHRHETLQLVFDIDQTFLLKDASSEWEAYSAAIIADGHDHQLDSNESIQLFIYLDRDTEYAKSLRNKYLVDRSIADLKGSGIDKVSTNFFRELLVSSDCQTLFKGFLTLINHLIEFKTPPPKDPRVLKAIAYISDIQNGTGKVREVAQHVCLSESRLRHLFKEQVGQPIQSFMLWMKVLHSLNLVLKGETITETAYKVGFWDVSHMNRSYKELIGVAPSTLAKYEKELRILYCVESNFHTFKTVILKDWQAQEITKTITI